MVNLTRSNRTWCRPGPTRESAGNPRCWGTPSIYWSSSRWRPPSEARTCPNSGPWWRSSAVIGLWRYSWRRSTSAPPRFYIRLVYPRMKARRGGLCRKGRATPMPISCHDLQDRPEARRPPRLSLDLRGGSAVPGGRDRSWPPWSTARTCASSGTCSPGWRRQVGREAADRPDPRKRQAGRHRALAAADRAGIPSSRDVLSSSTATAACPRQSGAVGGVLHRSGPRAR